MFFDTTADIYDASLGDDADPIAEGIACSIWPDDGSNSTTERGERFDWRGEVDVDGREHLIRQPNRQMVIRGIRYGVVGASLHEYVPHITVQLLELRPAG